MIEQVWSQTRKRMYPAADEAAVRAMVRRTRWVTLCAVAACASLPTVSVAHSAVGSAAAGRGENALLPASSPAVPSARMPTWHAPADLSAPGRNAASPRVAVDPQGNAVAVWDSSQAKGWIVESAVRPAGGVWQKPVALSAPASTSSLPQVAVDAQGNAVAIWHRSNGQHFVVQAAERPAGGVWKKPVDLAQDARHAQVDVNAQGNAVAVWQGFDGSKRIVRAAARGAGGAWHAPVSLSAPGEDASDAHVAVDRRGAAVAIWRRSSGTAFVVQSAERRPGGAWQAAVNITAGAMRTSAPQVGVDPQGNAIAVWERGAGTIFAIQGAVRPADAVWQEPVNLSAVGAEVFDPQVAIDARGDAVAVWGRFDAPNFVVQSAVRPAGAGWQTPVNVSAAGGTSPVPQVAVDPRGNAIAVWSRSNAKNSIVQGAVRPAGGAWKAPADLSAAGRSATHPQVAVDAGGSAVAVWQRFDGKNSIVQGAGYDDRGDPLLRAAITRLRLVPRAFLAARSGPAVKAAVTPTGTRLRYSLNVGVVVRFTVDRAVRGSRVDGRCVKATGGTHRRASCTLFVPVSGSFTRDRRHAAGDRFTFTGRLAGRTLSPGRYRLVATPIAAGRTGRPTRARFRIRAHSARAGALARFGPTQASQGNP